MPRSRGAHAPPHYSCAEESPVSATADAFGDARSLHWEKTLPGRGDAAHASSHNAPRFYRMSRPTATTQDSQGEDQQSFTRRSNTSWRNTCPRRCSASAAWLLTVIRRSPITRMRCWGASGMVVAASLGADGSRLRLLPSSGSHQAIHSTHASVLATAHSGRAVARPTERSTGPALPPAL